MFPRLLQLVPPHHYHTATPSTCGTKHRFFSQSVLPKLKVLSPLNSYHKPLWHILSRRPQLLFDVREEYTSREREWMQKSNAERASRKQIGRPPKLHHPVAQERGRGLHTAARDELDWQERGRVSDNRSSQSDERTVGLESDSSVIHPFILSCSMKLYTPMCGAYIYMRVLYPPQLSLPPCAWSVPKAHLIL